MLESVVEYVQPCPILLLGEESGLVAAFAHDYRTVQATSDEKRLIAKLLRRSAWINLEDTAGFAAIASRKDVKGNASVLQEGSQKNHKWSLPRTSDGQIAHADYRTVQPVCLQDSSVVEPIFSSYASAIKCAQGIQSVCASSSRGGRSAFSLCSVIAVAPCCACRTWRPRRPRACRSFWSANSFRMASGRSVALTTRTESWERNSSTMSRKFSVYGPTMIGTPCCAGSRILCPPTGTKLPPTIARSPRE